MHQCPKQSEGWSPAKHSEVWSPAKHSKGTSKTQRRHHKNCCEDWSPAKPAPMLDLPMLIYAVFFQKGYQASTSDSMTCRFWIVEGMNADGFWHLYHHPLFWFCQQEQQDTAARYNDLWLGSLSNVRRRMLITFLICLTFSVRWSWHVKMKIGKTALRICTHQVSI